MRHLLHIVSTGLSYLLYPLFVPTYGMALFCYALSQRDYTLNNVWITFAVVGTFVLTCLFPLIAILVLKWQGKISSIQMEHAAERKLPYTYSILGFALWAYMLIQILHAPRYINVVAVGGTVALVLVMWINRRWKISAHLTGFGGLFGGLLSYCLGTGIMPSWSTLGLWLGATLILMYSRLYLQAHTPAQVVAGWLLGMSCTIIPNCLINYVLS